MSKNKSLLAIGFTTISGLLFLFSLTPSGQDKPTGSRSSPGQKDDATPVEVGVMTPRQKEHSKLFNGNGKGAKPIDDAKKYGSINRVLGPGLDGQSPYVIRISREDSIKEITCDSHAVLTGTVVNKESQLTTDGESVFTDYDVRIDAVGKVDNHHLSKVNDTIIITRQGGIVRVKGLLISVEDTNSPALVVGQTYFFFLRRVPVTGAYLANNTTKIVNESRKLIGLGKDATSDLFTNTDVSLLLEEVRAAATACNGQAKP